MNRESLTQLKAAKQSLSVPAYLQVKGQDKGFYAFNYNPESFTDTLSASYASVSASSASVPYQDYQNGSGIKRSFSGLLMDTYSDGLSLRVIIDGIKDLMMAHPDKAEYEPPTLEFHWGSDSFKPCKLIDISYTIDLWLGGEPARGTLDLTLLQVPDTDSARIGSLPVIAPLASMPVNLTNRQKNDGINLAVAELKTNLSKISDSARNAVRTGQYKIILDELGVTKLIDNKGKELLKVGVYNGLKFISSLGIKP